MTFLKQHWSKLFMALWIKVGLVIVVLGSLFFFKTLSPNPIPTIGPTKEVRAIIDKENPTFNEVVFDICGNNVLLRGKQITWKSKVSDYAHTGGIRFWVIDEDHPEGSHEKHGHFWGTFLASADDPRSKQNGYIEWAERWHSSWVRYILDVYGNIDPEDRDSDTIFEVMATIDGASCEEREEDSIFNEGGYIETSVVKIKKIW